ncbi:hypothetical protein GWG67_08800 [Bradyrhizobium sp. CSS354]|nr:hypothetical protein [Bradyrhizobium sp. CSS354]
MRPTRPRHWRPERAIAQTAAGPSPSGRTLATKQSGHQPGRIASLRACENALSCRHCEEPLRRSNPDCFVGKILACFAALAMTIVVGSSSSQKLAASGLRA